MLRRALIVLAATALTASLASAQTPSKTPPPTQAAPAPADPESMLATIRAIFAANDCALPRASAENTFVEGLASSLGLAVADIYDRRGPYRAMIETALQQLAASGLVFVDPQTSTLRYPGCDAG
ncbi:hypothetical protein [Pararhodobacter zhoushanensis]|uniref:Uncharacterized protein n=1 Tax=Pararhodobacter zhoushanensis TaxID=2479545 RepID=A0ABT3GZM8_9RHOB|nr:hypothetical protein [Pararhodobacter zhoushanensis]MCW1933001.1 hypothetical protein [Pararhodobacter zhoushanensis]